ncbi:hypothetical protein EJB05_07578 [Eragrostis curvula]|uniref:Polymerase nucleotidyl transferase domain-containing protein n=1 Tax=Eragrostis curvula TaxID=38414 RepID=A0A5J9WKU7_9POAL|nr:hypothetical protein EJB05_07578 [Eragrostis curvula]
MGMVPNGLLPNASAGVTRRLDPERWAVAEGRTAELIALVQPNEHSEGMRFAVFHYVRRLIMSCLACQVFTFGSVPLRTYLPDGDIDVTAFSNSEELKEIWADIVRDALEREEKNENAEFRVKEVQYIQAEVKIIKCLVANIPVDISFNQVGGLCTLCFLEQVDNLINRNHLFKRSIILIKAWCFYESRILGAHHGLISTYALETLVLYIFHIYNNSCTGPLEVLFRFLEFFSNFDWEKFCLSLAGPVPISSLPDMTAEPPRMDSDELLLSKAFQDFCSSAYGVTNRTQERQGQPFVSKHFNVIDPLRTNNNLGRSVNKVDCIFTSVLISVLLDDKILHCAHGNFFRIRSAFAFGAKRLGKLLDCPKEDLIAELNQFFTSTWKRYGSGSRPDVPTPSLVDVHPLKVVPAVVSNSHRSVTTIKRKTENPKLRANEDNLAEIGQSYPDPSSQAPYRSDLHTNASGTRPPMAHYIYNPNFAANVEDDNQSEKPNSLDEKYDTGNNLHEYTVGFSGHFGSEGRDPSIYNVDGKEHSSLLNDVTEVDDGPRNGAVPINEASEIVTGFDSLSMLSNSSQLPNDFDSSQMGMPSPMFAPFLIGSPQLRQADNSGLTFFPTSTPVPFVIFPFVPGNNDGSVPQFERSEGTDQHPANITGQKFSSVNDVHQPDTRATSTALCGIMAEPPSDEHKPDILNSDLIGHWRNLQYVKLCQNAPPMGPVLYPFAVPPIYLQGHAPWDGPGRPVAPNVNWTQMAGPNQRVFPVMPVQPASERPTGAHQHYGEDSPRYRGRGGTGMYLPNPKVPFRDRNSGSRNYRGGYSSDRSDHSDKEGSWVNSKQHPNRSYGRGQSERSGMRSDRHATDENQFDRQRRTFRNDSYRHEAGAQYLGQGQSFGSTNSIRKPANVAHGGYTPSTVSNGASALYGPPGPPFFMVYEPGVNRGASSSEPIEFGSLGPLPTADGDDIPRSTRQVMPNGFYGQKPGPYRGGSSHSSPDQPSSPQPRR